LAGRTPAAAYQARPKATPSASHDPHLRAQLGLHSDEAVRIATDAGLAAVTNRCLKIEHARFADGLHVAGYDTGLVSSRRRGEL
jgi:predicted CoA-binding protein